jgi:hypothetical protein
MTMPLPLIFLAAKGIATLLATKAGAVLAIKSVLAFGVAATLKGLFVAGIVTFGVKWYMNNVNNLKLVVDAFEKGDHEESCISLAKLAISLHIPAHDLPSHIGEYMQKLNVAQSIKNAVVQQTAELVPAVTQYMPK